jgi:hypothetical protein
MKTFNSKLANSTEETTGLSGKKLRENKKRGIARKFTSLDRDDDSNVESGLTVAYQEGTGHMIHVQHPDYFHVPAAAENVARHYIRNYVKPGDTVEDHKEAVRLFGINRSRLGEWYYDRDRSLLADTPTLGDDMQIPIRSRIWRDPAQGEPSLFIKRGMKVSHLVYSPSTICGHDATGEWSQDPRDIKFHEDNCSENGHAEGCNIDLREIGQYKDATGKVRKANPLKVMNEAQSYMTAGIADLLRRKAFTSGNYLSLMKGAAQYIHGRINKPSDPTPDGREYHGIANGAKPWFGENHVNGLVNNIPDFYEVDEGRVQKSLGFLETQKNRLKQLKTANYVCCFCPYCSIDGQKRLGSQWQDIQFHEQAGKNDDHRIRDSYFHCEKDKKGNVISQGFHLYDLPNGMAMQDLGEQEKRTPHRVFFGDRDFEKTIRHYARHAVEETRNITGYLRPRISRIGEIPNRGFTINPESIASNLAINPDVAGKSE